MCQTEPAEEAKRRSLSSSLENEGLFLHGFAPFAPFRDRLLSCRAAARLPAQPRTVLAALFPYRFADNGPRNLSRYACVPDYHDAAGEVLARAARRLETDFPGFSFVPFIDNSPVPEVEAAARAGLGVVGDNGLLIHPLYGSYVFIGELVTDLPLKGVGQEPEGCLHCGRCTAACPGGCLTPKLDPDPGASRRETCLSALTQKKGLLTEEEERLVLRGGLVWGCDRCQEVCPLNSGARCDPHPCFHNQYRPLLTPADLDDLSGKAYGWRGRKVPERNLHLFEEKALSEECGPPWGKGEEI